MKKILLLAIVTIAIIAFASDAPATAKTASDEHGAYTPIPDGVKGITIIYADDNREGSIGIDGILFFQKLLNERSGGKITLDVHPSLTLGTSNADIFESVCAGFIQMTNATPSSAVLGSDTGILDVPALYTDWSRVWKCLQESEFHDELVKLVASKGSTALYFAPKSYRVMTSNTPIRAPEDIKGITMRLPANPVWISLWSKLGANVVSMPMSEVYIALQQGVASAQENSWEQLVNNNLLEVQKYLIFTNHVMDPFGLYINTDYYNSMDPAIRTLFDECLEVLYGWFDKNVDAYIERIVKQGRAQAEKYGATFMDADPSLVAAMVAATEDIVREVRSYSATADKMTTLALKAMGHDPDFGK